MIILSIVALLFSMVLKAQQVIGSFPSMNGGFEGQTTVATLATIPTNTTSTNWTVQNNSGTTIIFTTGGRSGPTYVTFGATASRRLQSPTTTANSILNTTSYTIQFYYRTSGATGASLAQNNISPDGTPAAGTYSNVTLNGTNGAWTKKTQSQTSGSSANTPKYGIGIFRFNGVSVVDIDIDDYAIYAGAADVTAPNSPSSISISPNITSPTTKLDISWGAASGGVDGGGYVVVRFASSPAAADDPNPNGIYAVNNTITGTVTGTVVYIGTGTSFTDDNNNTGLTPGTTYYYKVYTVDKAFNYSAEISGNANTAVVCTSPSTQASALSLLSTTGVSMDISFTRGNGTTVLVVAKAGSVISNDPFSGYLYTANSVYGSGTSLGGGYVMYNGIGSSATITGLTMGTTYYINVYEYGAGPCYTIPALSGSLITPGTPTLASLTVANITESQADLGATITNDGGMIVTERGTLYKTTSGVTIADNKLADAGSGTGIFSDTRIGLSAQTQYYYKAYANNSIGTALSSESSFYTLSNPPLSEATGFVGTPVDIDEIDLSWTAGTFPSSGASVTGYVILRRQDYTDPSISDIVNGIAPASLTLSMGTTLITTISSGATTLYNNTGLSTNQQYNYLIVPFTWDGSHSTTYHYYTTNALTGNALTFPSTGSTDLFRTKPAVTSGNWNSTTTWQSRASVAVSWHTATSVPTSFATSVEITNGHTVTINAAASVNALIIDNGGTLNHTNGFTLNIADGSGYDGSGVDFIINGTYVMNGTAPTFLNSASAQVSSTGIVRVDNNTSGQSDDFARLTNVEFQTGAIFYWNTVLAFETDNATYFQGPNYATNKPTFKISAAVSVGANTATTFNGKFESTTSNPQFKNSGTKVFRDGLGGSGKITHTINSGPFEITASDAVIDGSLTLNIDDAPGTNDLWIASGATVTISGSPSLNIGTNAAGSDMVIDGTLIHNGSVAVQIASGNLYINGYLDSSSTGSFSFSSTTPTLNSNISVGGASNTYAGSLKLTLTANYVNTFTINRGTSGTGGYLLMNSDMNVKNITLSHGVLATGNNLVTWLNSGGTLTSPNGTNYSDSYICTCYSTGTEVTSTGSNGFRINNVSGSTDQLFPVGTDFVSANRMAINMNSSTPDNFTVVVGKGDIGNTPKPRVNRIWHLSEGIAGGSTATMKLYFTKRDWNNYPSSEDEVEYGFLYSDPHFVQKDALNQFYNNASGADVIDFTSSSNGTEIYGLYTKGVSSDAVGSFNGIYSFYRFSVVNANDIILPVTISNFKVYQKDARVQIDWTALNEINIDHYEIEKSYDGSSFTLFTSLQARHSGGTVNYAKTDASPAMGSNYYRLKLIDKNGAVSYTEILKVSIGKHKTFIAVYPNPVPNKFIHVQFSNIIGGKYQLVMYNSVGQLMFSKLIENAGGSAIQNITLPSTVKPGIYLIKISNETINFITNVVVE